MPVRREDILDYLTYGERRDALRLEAMAAKDLRRVHVGEHLTFLFENQTTIRYQVQEMVRAERLVREADIRHELDTYNDLLGGPGVIGCTLLIEIDDPVERTRKLTQWRDLPRHLYVALDDGEGEGTRVRARFDERQVGDERLSAVQYLKFDTRGAVPVAVGSDHPGLRAETKLTPQQRRALEADLRAEEPAR